MITVVIAEDHPIARRSIRRLLERADDVAIVGEAADGTEALTLINRAPPDVLIADMFMQPLNGLDLISRVSQSGVPTRIVAISMFTDEFFIQQTLNVGAHAFISKRELAKALLPAIRTVFQGNGATDIAASND